MPTGFAAKASLSIKALGFFDCSAAVNMELHPISVRVFVVKRKRHTMMNRPVRRDVLNSFLRIAEYSDTSLDPCRDSALQFLEPVEYDVQLRDGRLLVAFFQHDKPLAVGSYVI